jgi:hypothetical protein
MDLKLLVKIEGEARRAVRALNPKTAAKRGPTFAEVVARIAGEEAAGRPGILHQGLSSLPSKPSKPGLRVLRVPIHDPFLDQPPQWGFI